MTPVPETKWRDSTAYAPRFFLSMAIALAAFATITYIGTGSLATTAIRTLVCAVLIQAGYFLTLLFLVRRAAKARKAGEAEPEKPKAKVAVSMNEPGHSKP